jgi:hypothetical protein
MKYMLSAALELELLLFAATHRDYSIHMQELISIKDSIRKNIIMLAKCTINVMNLNKSEL